MRSICPFCNSDQLIKSGYTRQNKQRPTI
ncbi:transposase-like zinc-binding domain-containing protein [Avrilella dinanensis]